MQHWIDHYQDYFSVVWQMQDWWSSVQGQTICQSVFPTRELHQLWKLPIHCFQNMNTLLHSRHCGLLLCFWYTFDWPNSSSLVQPQGAYSNVEIIATHFLALYSSTHVTLWVVNVLWYGINCDWHTHAHKHTQMHTSPPHTHLCGFIVYPWWLLSQSSTFIAACITVLQYMHCPVLPPSCCMLQSSVQ